MQSGRQPVDIADQFANVAKNLIVSEQANEQASKHEAYDEDLVDLDTSRQANTKQSCSPTPNKHVLVISTA